MIINNFKLKFGCDKALEIIKSAKYSEFEKSSYSGTISLKPSKDSYVSRGMYSISIETDEKISKIKYFRIKKDNDDIKFEFNPKFSKQFEDVLKIALETVSRIEDEEFKRFFPDYDKSIERDSKIEELLNIVEEINEKNSETLDIVEENKIEPKKRFWFFNK